MHSCEYFDVHSHIENYGEYDKIPALFQDGENKTVGVLMMGMDAPSFLAAKKIEAKCENAAACFGIHPWNAHLYFAKTDMFEQYVREAKIVGEIGLDAKWSREEFRHLQTDVFYSQLDLAKRYSRPVSIHTVGMENECFEAIKSAGVSNVCIHWFHGGVSLAKKYLDIGCYFSLAPDVGFSPDADALAKYMPPERILIETDGADCFAWARKCEKSPWQYKPKAIIDVYSHVAKVRGSSLDTLKMTVKENFFRFSKL